MNDEESRTGGDLVDRELVAYLDGELDGGAAGQVEQRLSQDAHYQRRLQQLQQTWDLLDYLPRAMVEEKFAHSTVEMVAVAAAEDVKHAKAAVSRRRPLRWIIGGGSIAAAAFAGYFLVSELAARPNDSLLKDLPVIENIDLYLPADSIDFLRELDKEGLFAEEADDAM